MIGIMVVTHGQFGDGLVQSAHGIVGKQENIGVVSILPHDSLSEIRHKCADMFQQIEQGDGVLIMTDILGGTSCNASLPLVKKKTAILTGVNLPMLITAMIHRSLHPLDALTEKVLQEGKKSMVNAREMFLKKLT
jgi:mannose/fructose/sorbose-specific phosphotransferase system IIA component